MHFKFVENQRAMKNLGLKILGGGIGLFVLGYAFAMPSNASGELHLNAKNTACCKVAQLQPINTNKLFYYVGGKHDKTVTQKQLAEANHLDDIIPNYPTLWMDTYEKVNLTVAGTGFSKSVVSPSPTLTDDQKLIIADLPINSEVLIDVYYGAKNSITQKIEPHVMNIQFMVVPSKPAQFGVNEDALKNYLRSNLYPGIVGEEKVSAEIHFTVNEDGKTENVVLERQKGSLEMANAYVKIVSKMPKWSPAQKKNGKPVSQDFVLVVGNEGC